MMQSLKSLFRAGAPADLLTPSPQSEGRVGVGVIALFFVGFLGMAALAPLDAAVVGQGIVKVSGNRQTMQVRDGGTIAKMHVREGDRVKKDQILITFAAQDLISEERALTGLIIELEATKARILAEISGGAMLRPDSWEGMPEEHKEQADDVFARHRSELQARRSSMQNQLAVLSQRQAQVGARSVGYVSELAATDRQIALISDELAALRDLAKDGFAPENRVRSVERQKAELEARRSQITSAMEQTREAAGESQMQALSLRSDRREAYSAELRGIEQKLVELLPNLASVRERVARAQLRAPQDGVVVGMRVFNSGEVVQPADPIMYIVPDEALMIVETAISPNDVDDLRTGVAADVRFPGLSGRKFNLARGTVTRVSADSFKDERTGRDYYLAEVQVPQAELTRLAEMRGESEVGLRPGLHAEVVVPLRKRTALEYLVEPLNQSFWISFREH